MKITLCKNSPKIKKFEKKLADAFPDASIKITSCIGGMCKKCKIQPVAKVDGERFKAKKVGKLIQKIEGI
ncbi:MAG TPA: DUF1450 domain-containing protein [Campylobacterales bacterium]|nr:DUF1450 domain-containing protein [Campylobacterales bacterium]